MHKHRVVIDLQTGRIDAESVELVELVPGEVFYRDYAGKFAPVASAEMHSGERFVITALHDSLAAAKQQAAAELFGRREHLHQLAEQCQQIVESTNV